MVHNAIKITKEAQSGTLHLNPDGTTKSQKLQGVAMNGMVVSVNEVPDGSGDNNNDISKVARNCPCFEFTTTR